MSWNALSTESSSSPLILIKEHENSHFEGKILPEECEEYQDMPEHARERGVAAC